MNDRTTARQVEMQKAMDSLHQRLNTVEAVFESGVEPDLSEIYTALAKAQVEIQNAAVNVDNEFTKKKYADLASVLDAVRGPLAKNGIAIIQVTCDPGEPGIIGIKTILAHSSGQTLEDLLTMAPPKNDPQGIGSCRTYLRRYSLLAMTGIAGATDDDAEGTKVAAANLSPEQVDEVFALADKLFKAKSDATIKRMLSTAFPELTSVSEIPAEHYQQVVNLLNNQAKREKQPKKPKKPPTTESKEEPGADG